MSSPGYPTGGAPELYGGAGRSIAAAAATNMNNHPTAATNNHHPLLHQSHRLYRNPPNLPAIFLDPSSQIARQTPSLIGKRTLAEYQTQQNHNQNQILSNLLLRSVKPRTFQHSSPISHLSPMDFPISPELQNPSPFGTQRFGMPLLQQLRPNPINLPNGTSPMNNSVSILPNTGVSFPPPNFGQVQNRVQTQEPEKKIMDHRLLELEKQLLEDNDEEEGDAVSVITSNATNEWSETIQNLISPGQKPISSSPTSSTTSSTSSSSVASPASGSSKQSLMEVASAISEGKWETASEILMRLSQVSNPNGNSDQRLTDCMVSALKSKLNPVDNPPPIAELFGKEHTESTQLLFDKSPCFVFGFMAANLAILEATSEEKQENGCKFRVVDFDIGQGNQYVNLLRLLSSRQNGKPATVRITAVAENGGEERLKTVGDMLSRTAKQGGVGFEFKVITQKLTELTRESLGCEPDELLAVNFAFKLYRMPDESVSMENLRDELLRRVKGLAPRVVTLVEQEMNTNTAPFVARVTESCSYYSALFESNDSVMAREDLDRVRVEQGLSRKMRNSVACEGRDRVERCEVYGKWRARMSMAGFQLKPLSKEMVESIKARFNPPNRVNPGFTVKEENGGVCFGWKGRTLTVASAWR